MILKVLFVCTQNKWRSLTAEKIFSEYSEIEVRSAGTSEHARVRVGRGHIGWADYIFVMEKKHLQAIKSKFGDLIREKNIFCLHIEDDYQFMDEELIALLKAGVHQHLDLKH